MFPLGEIEFKRHAGPNWLSLSQPAVLPLTIDYYPPPQELNTFLIGNWDIEVDIEGSHYKSHTELMMEMIRQRLTQEYQVKDEKDKSCDAVQCLVVLTLTLFFLFPRR